MSIEINIYLVIIFNIAVLGLGYLFLYIKGFRKHILFAFSWVIFTIYYFITPLYFYSIDRKTIWGDSYSFYGVGEIITDYYDDGFLFFGLAHLFFFLGYFFVTAKTTIKSFDSHVFKKNRIVLITVLCFLIVYFNFAYTGISPLDVLLGISEESLFGAVGESNYLRNFADSLITCLIICVFVKVDKRFIYIMSFVSFVLFLLMGFRYRIIICLLGFILLYLFKTKIEIKKVIKPMILFSFIMYFILFITVNRYNLILGKFDQLESNPIKFEVGLLLAEQTRGALDDITIIKYYDSHINARHDYGLTFLFFAIRALPRSIFGDWKDQIYPPPAFPIINEAYNLPAAYENTGEAPLHYAYFIIAGGLFFLLIGSFFIGVILRYISINRHYNFPKDKIFLIIICMALFQLYTRGYFPQFVDHLFFLLIPYWLYFGWSQRNHIA